MAGAGAGPVAANSGGCPGGGRGTAAGIATGGGPGAAGGVGAAGGGMPAGVTWAAAGAGQVAATHSPAVSAHSHRVTVIDVPPSPTAPRAGTVALSRNGPARSVREPRGAVDILLLQLQALIDVQ